MKLTRHSSFNTTADRDMALLWHWEEVANGSFAVVGFSLREDAAIADGDVAACLEPRKSIVRGETRAGSGCK